MTEQDNYSGVATLDGVESYVNTRMSGGIAIVSAIDVRTLNDMLSAALIVVFLAFVLLAIILFFGCLGHQLHKSECATPRPCIVPEMRFLINERGQETPVPIYYLAVFFNGIVVN